MSIRVRHFYGARWGIVSDRYSPALREVARSTPGITWDPEGKAWCGYLDAVEVVAARLRDERGMRIDTSAIDDGVVIDTIPVKETGLYAYQKEDLRWLVRQWGEGAIVAWEMGLGKTALALRGARAMRAPALVICPAFVAGVWVDEVKKWWPEVTPVVLKGLTPSELPLSQLYICNYSIVHAWKDVLLPVIQTLILDEVHMLQGRETRRNTAILALARNAHQRVGLTGTPMTNRPKDLHNLCDVISEGRFGKFFGYALRYTDAHKEEVAKNTVVWKFDGRSNEEELGLRLKHFMVRRTKIEVGAQLPPKTRQVVTIETKKRLTVATDFSKRALRASLDAAADAKLPQVVDLLASHVEGGSRVVCFTYRRAVAEYLSTALTERGVKATFVHGGLPTDKRRKRLDDAAANGTSVVCATIDSTGVGISLTFADVAVFAELTYEPHEILQAEARLHRKGQTRPVLVQFVIAAGSSDELIRAAIIAKLDTFEAVIGEGGGGLQDALAAEAKKTTEAQLKSFYERLMAGG